MKKMLKCSVGTMAHNEEKNIARLFESLQRQDLQSVEISDIIIVASGCTDRTVEIARRFAEKNPKIKVLVQEKREGKASAVNLWLKNAETNILVMESADTIPEKDAVEKLVSSFQNPKIGMVGARPVPTNDPKTFMGYAVHLLWNLHHHISLKNPKMGEMVAFRKIISEIPVDTAVDEAEIEAGIRKQGFETVYVPSAIVHNKGPRNTSDFLKQRRRIHAGHLELKKKGYSVSTSSGRKIFFLLLRNIDWNMRSLIFTPFVIALEIWGRILGWYDWKIAKKKSFVWEIAESTKELY